MAFYTLEPFGTEAGYLGHAITSATIANANKPKGKKAYTPKDFMPGFRKKKKQTTDAMIGIASMITQARGGKDLR